MPKQVMMTVFNVETEGLPPEEVRPVAFLFDGDIHSGWPLPPECPGDDAPWEDTSGRKFYGVTHWVTFDTPLLDL